MNHSVRGIAFDKSGGSSRIGDVKILDIRAQTRRIALMKHLHHVIAQLSFYPGDQNLHSKFSF